MDLFLISGMEWFHCMFSWRVGAVLFLCLVGGMGISRLRLVKHRYICVHLSVK